MVSAFFIVDSISSDKDRNIFVFRCEVFVQACITVDIAFQLPDFFLQGVDLLVDGFQPATFCPYPFVFTHLWTKTYSTSANKSFESS